MSDNLERYIDKSVNAEGVAILVVSLETLERYKANPLLAGQMAAAVYHKGASFNGGHTAAVVSRDRESVVVIGKNGQPAAGRVGTVAVNVREFNRYASPMMPDQLFGALLKAANTGKPADFNGGTVLEVHEAGQPVTVEITSGQARVLDRAPCPR